MLDDMAHLSRLSEQFEINPEDILLIAINSSGIANRHTSRRARFKFAPFGREDDPVYLIPSFERELSPFHISDGTLFLRSEPVGTVRSLKDDDIVMGYFRNGHSNLTLNSNARSVCTGCMFCYTRLDPASDPHISEEDELDAYLAFIEADNGWNDLGHVKKISVCSGCFHFEAPAIRHMELVGDMASRHGFSGELHILSSVIQSRAGMQRLAERLSPFHLTMTVECFDNRHEILKRSKAELTFDKIVEALAEAKAAGLKIDFTYLVGLDALEALDRIEILCEQVTTFPRFQIYQPHNTYQASYRAPGSERIEYFLTARKRLERIFEPTPLRPQSWENYRPLWYYGFAGRSANSPRI
jgi:hypothetical protein